MARQAFKGNFSAENFSTGAIPSSWWCSIELEVVLHAGSTANAQVAELMRLANDLKAVARRMELKHASMKGPASSQPPSPS